MEIKIFEHEILDLIKQQDQLPYLSYTRARYEQAKSDLTALRKAELLKQGQVFSSISIPDSLPNPVPGWGWE